MSGCCETSAIIKDMYAANSMNSIEPNNSYINILNLEVHRQETFDDVLVPIA